jgi:hypothetical protein
MKDKFDELAKEMAQSVTRRGALKRFGLGLAGLALTSLGLTEKTEAAPQCKTDADCANLGLISPACCSNKCVDLDHDRDNCGACHVRCRGKFTCCFASHCDVCF